MATNNFLPWGDNAGNIMDGADYEASTQRTDGVELGLADPALHNRLYRQVTLMAAALGQVIADNGLDATDSNMAGLVQAIKNVFFAVVPVDKGGTGATDAAGARNNLGVTPQNIGALPTSGGTMTDSIQFDGSTVGLIWITTNGTHFSLRPYSDGNVFQITTNGPNTGDTEIPAFDIHDDGHLHLYRALGVDSGGTGAADALGAAISLGLSDPDEMDFAATDAADWENQVKAHILERIQNRRCMMFTAGWSGRGFGSGLAWKAAGNVYVLIFNQEATQTLKFWFYMATDQSWRDIGIG